MRRIKTIRKPSVILYIDERSSSIYSITLVFCVVFARVSVGEKWLKHSVFTAQAALFCSAKILAISDSFFSRRNYIWGQPTLAAWLHIPAGIRLDRADSRSRMKSRLFTSQYSTVARQQPDITICYRKTGNSY